MARQSPLKTSALPHGLESSDNWPPLSQGLIGDCVPADSRVGVSAPVLLASLLQGTSVPGTARQELRACTKEDRWKRKAGSLRERRRRKKKGRRRDRGRSEKERDKRMERREERQAECWRTGGRGQKAGRARSRHGVRPSWTSLICGSAHWTPSPAENWGKASGTRRAFVLELALLSPRSRVQLFFCTVLFRLPSLSFMVPSTAPARRPQFWNASLVLQRGAGSAGVID